jgi:hypothetical protein
MYWNYTFFMGLITEYKDVTGECTYTIHFKIDGCGFCSDRLDDASDALRVYESLYERGLFPEISQDVRYVSNGVIVEPDEHRNIWWNELEAIANGTKQPPSIKVPIVESNLIY